MYLVVDFRTEQGDAVSAIVAGDNGTGKSSIVDALEFALQAWINRSQSFVNRKSNEPIGDDGSERRNPGTYAPEHWVAAHPSSSVWESRQARSRSSTVSTTASSPSSVRLVTSEHLPWREIFAGRSGSFGNSIQARVPSVCWT